MNAANQRNSTPKWSDVANDQDFQSADWETRQKVRGEFYRRVVEPETPAELREEVQGKFFTQTEPDVFGERDSSADSERFSYPGAAADQSALDERQQGEASQSAPQQDNGDEDAPGLASNALRNAGERGLDLAGNAVQFVGNMAEMGEKLITDHLGGLNPGVIGGESDAMRERGYEPDLELGGYGLDFTARAKPEDTDTGLTGAGQAVEDVGLGYQPNYTIDRALDNPSVETLAGAAAEQGPAALADMAGLAINLPAYLSSRTQEIGESRAQNEGRDGMPEGGDYAVAGPTAAASVLLDRFALGRLLPGGKGAVSKASQVPGAVGRATATEATTEAVQEGGIEYAGESLGTEQGWDPVTAGRRAAGGAIVGGPTGGAVRAGTAAAEVAGGRASVAEDESGQADNSPEEESSPETQQANEEAVGAAAELIRRPRFELSSSEREVRDSITYGDAFKSLRAAAEAQGDTEAVAELDAVSEEVSSALEDETLARSSGEEDAIEPIRQRLDGAAQRFTSTMERINSQRSDSQSPENDIERAAAETDTEPTPAQAEAGNYRKGKVRLNGFEVAIENPKGSTRRGTAQDGTEWESQMAHHYGDIKGTTAADGDNLDVFVGENPSSPQAYIIDQVDEDGGFDEHKVMLGFDSLDDARQGYLDNYEDGWKGLGEISEISVENFRQWVREGNTRAPFAMPDTQARDEDGQSDEESASRQQETTYLADDTPVETRFRVVDMADVTPSNRADGQVNPSFPPELQPRDRTNANSQVQVRNIAARLNPERLGSSPDAGSGAPITGPDGVVESGNGRAMAIATAYRQGGERAEGYRDFVRAQAEERGIKADLDGMRRPMLVRERTSDLDRADFARRANESQVAGMTSYEQAQTDADAMTADDVQSWSPDQSGDPLAASNRDFQRAFVSRLGNNEASRYTTRQGQAAPELGRRMSRAVFAKAYADPDMVELITEQGDQMRNLSSALQSAAPDLAMARETGSQDALDTIATINDAVRLVRASRRDGAPIRELVSQADAFSEPTSELTADLAILVNTNMRSRASLEQALGFVAQDARRRAESARNGALFEDATTSEDAIREGFRQAPAEDTDGQRAPEDDVPGRPDESEQEPSQRREADPSEGAAEAQEVSDSPLLESYTEQDVAEREQAAQQGVEGGAESNENGPIFEQYPEGFRYILRDPQAPRWQSEHGQAAADGEVGRIMGDERGDRLIIRNTGIQADYQGAGRATDAYADLADRAHRQGKILTSDVEVTPAAARIYERLEERGYQVTRSQTARLEDVEGESKWVTDRGSVFTVRPPVAETSQGEEGSQQNDAEGFTLDTQTEASLANRDREQQQAEQANADRRRQDEQRAAADREADDFALSGSDLPADQANARGQDPLFAFAGEGAQNADRHALENARSRIEAGDDAEVVRQETGWFRGPDNRWRFEIDDSDARFLPFVDGTAGQLWTEKLDRVLDHPKLYAAYPSLREVSVVSARGMPANRHGSYHHRRNEITLNAESNAMDQFSYLLHEVQHGIQHREGFATGGTPADYRLPPRQEQRLRDKIQELTRESGDFAREVLERYKAGEISTEEAQQQIQQRADEIGLNDLRQKLREGDARGAYRYYQRLYGETEARNVQARQGLTEAERADTPPSKTQDVPDSDVVVVYNGQEIASAPAPDNAEVSPESAPQAPRAEAIRARLSEHPELSGVEVVQSARELPTQVQLVMAMQGVEASDVSGVYNPDTGAPMIVADNLIDEADGVRKAVHEGVGHYGIRGMLGEELEPLMLEIYQSHTRSNSGRQNIEEIQQTYPFIDVATRKGKITLAEELVAHYIEGSNGRPKLGQRIMSTIRRLLRKLFPGIQWRTSDILAMGDQARRWLRRQQAARDVGDSDNRYSFSEQQEELSAQDLAAQLREEYPGLKLDMASRGQKATISRIVAPEREQGTGSAVMRRLTDWADASGRTMALTPSSDFGGSVKRLHEFYRRFGFVENKGRNKDYEISEAMYREPDHGVGDVRFSLTQQPGTVGGKYSSTDSTGFSMPDESLRNAALRKMADKMRPLKILEDAIRRTGRDIEEEADAYLAEELFHGKVEHDLRQLREQHVEPLAEGLAKANLSQAELDDYLYARHAPERNATTAERNPDNPEMQDGGSGMTNAQAAEIIERVANSGKQAEYDRLANIVYDMTRLRREAIRDGGLEDDAMIDAWEANWQYYVPLKGNASDDPGRPRTGRGFEISGRESRIAGGRTSLAESPSSQVIVDVNESLIRRRKNEVAQSLLSLVTDNPNPALWEVFTDENPDTQRTPTRITDPETGQSRVEVQERPVNMAGNDRYFKAKRAGRTYYLKLHDERLMNAMRNVGPENNGVLIRAAGAVTRVMSSLVTSYNPEFMLTNFARDVQTALLNLSAEQTRDDGKIKGEAVVRQTARDIAPSMRAAWRGLRGKAGKNDGSREWDQWFREFQEDGAKTGYFDMKDLNAQAKEIQSMIRRADGTTLSHMLKARKKTADFVENMNGAVENAVRLSAYANARRAGVSRKKAASLAKNMTVNFNRRGEAGTALNAAYMFANASIQGTMNFARTMVTVKNAPEGKSQMNVWARMNMAQKLGLGMATGSFMLGMLNRWLSDEDEDGVLFYDKIPDYEKERNIILMTGWMGEDPEDYIKLPLPYGYNVFSVAGTHAESVTAGTEEPAEAAKNLVLAVAGSFSPIGFEDSDELSSLFLKNLTPTIFRSITQVGVNENFAGSPIYREDFPFGTPTPDSSRAFRSTPEAYQDFAKFLNEFTGGTSNISGAIDVNPDVMQHLVNYYGGGAWGFVEKTADFAKRVATGEEVERYRVPFAGRFSGNVSEYGDMQRFYERRDELGQIANEADSLRGREKIDYRRDHQQQLRLFNRATNLEKQLTELRKRRDRIEETETLTDEAKKRRTEMVEKQMKRRIDDFNKRYNKIE